MSIRSTILLVAALGCLAVAAYGSTPRLKRSESTRVVTTVAIRELDGHLRGTLVAAAYIKTAIYLAEHSKTRIAPAAPMSPGKGYLLELIEDGVVVDRFELWPGEIVLHGHRWAIEDEATEAQARLHWNLQ